MRRLPHSGARGRWHVLLAMVLVMVEAPAATHAYPVPATFFADPSSIADSLDGVVWLNRMAVKAQLDSYMPPKLPGGIRYPCPKDEELLLRMGMSSTEFQEIAVSCTGGPELAGRLKTRLGVDAFARLRATAVVSPSSSSPSSLPPPLGMVPRVEEHFPRMLSVEDDGGSINGGHVGVSVVQRSSTADISDDPPPPPVAVAVGVGPPRFQERAGRKDRRGAAAAGDAGGAALVAGGGGGDVSSASQEVQALQHQQRGKAKAQIQRRRSELEAGQLSASGCWPKSPPPRR